MNKVGSLRLCLLARVALFYDATQQCRRDLGSFDCWDCMTEVLCWSGDYRYSNWDPIDAAQDPD
jgi:hypothetical protein